MNAQEYVQRQQKLQQPLDTERLCFLTGDKPAAFRFLQEVLTPTKAQLSEARIAQQRAESMRQRRAKQRGGCLPAKPEALPATPCASSDSSALADNLRRLMDAIG